MKNLKKYRTGIVLAAGLGSRLVKSKSNYKNKPLVQVEGVSLLLRTLCSLELACDQVVIVLGFDADTIRSFVEKRYSGPMQLIFVINKDYKLSNGVSVLAARQYVKDDFILAMADHVMEDSLLEAARSHSPVEGGGALLVDYKLSTIFDLDDATKVLEKNGKILSIGKQLTNYNCIDTGLFVCTTALLDILAVIYREKGDVSLSEGIQKLSENGLMMTIDILEGFWQDVDTQEMLDYAQMQLVNRRQNEER